MLFKLTLAFQINSSIFNNVNLHREENNLHHLNHHIVIDKLEFKQLELLKNQSIDIFTSQHPDCRGSSCRSHTHSCFVRCFLYFCRAAAGGETLFEFVVSL